MGWGVQYRSRPLHRFRRSSCPLIAGCQCAAYVEHRSPHPRARSERIILAWLLRQRSIQSASNACGTEQKATRAWSLHKARAQSSTECEACECRTSRTPGRADADGPRACAPAERMMASICSCSRWALRRKIRCTPCTAQRCKVVSRSHALSSRISAMQLAGVKRSSRGGGAADARGLRPSTSFRPPAALRSWASPSRG